jgi:hypothetical protein
MAIFKSAEMDQKTKVADDRSGPIGSAISDIEEAVKKPRKPYTKRSTETSEEKTAREKQEKISQELEKIFDPSIWEPILSLPANLMLAYTGDEKIWNLSDKEVKTMANTTSVAMRHVGIEDPKWFAIAMASVAIIMVYAPRTTKHIILQRQKIKKRLEVVQ